MLSAFKLSVTLKYLYLIICNVYPFVLKASGSQAPAPATNPEPMDGSHQDEEMEIDNGSEDVGGDGGQEHGNAHDLDQTMHGSDTSDSDMNTMVRNCSLHL